MAHTLVGKNYTTPDLIAKVTGRARYAEDYRVEGMLYCKLLLSPMPHARVRRLDTRAALAMPGVKAIITANDMPGPVAGANLGEGVQASAQGERALTNEPLYEGEPILALAAVDELTAAEAIEAIELELELLPFVTDSVNALRPDTPLPRPQGNAWVRPTPQSAPQIQQVKWTDADFEQAADGQLPLGKAAQEWSYGDVEEGLKKADLVLDQTFTSPNTSHQPLETRSAMAYWERGKLYLHGSTQSTVQTVASVARWIGIPAENVVIISEYTGGGFGSKIPGAISMAIPALLSKQANAPVMMRISREEEHFIGRARPSITGRLKVGFRSDGRVLAVDAFLICDNGPYDMQGDAGSAADIISLLCQPEAMRFRGLTILTNTPPRVSQRAPGGVPAIAMIEPILAKAARNLGIDQVDIHRINAPEGKAPIGQVLASGQRAHVTSSFAKEAIDRGRELFRWDERKVRSGQRHGSRARGLGVAVSPYSAGSIGFDGLFVIKPDGKMYIQSGVGNHGTHSLFDVHRVAAEIIGVPWEDCVVTWGNTGKHLPWTCSSGGSQTLHAMSRAAHAAAMDGKRKLQEIAARDLGGSPESYQLGEGRVFRGGGPGMTLARAAQRAIELGGKYDGHEVAEDLNLVTKRSARELAGQGLMGVARDNYARDGQSRSTVVGFAEVEVDLEIGSVRIIDFLAVADVGTVVNPRSLRGQVLGGCMLGVGHALFQKWIYDQHYGVALAKRFYQNKPPSILDAPLKMTFEALDLPDPETPVGARGAGEPPVGSAYGSVLNAIIDAIGPDLFQRAPVTLDMILTSLEAGKKGHGPLTANI